MNLPEQLRRHPWKIAIVLLAVAAGAWFLQAHRDELTREAILAYGKGLPAAWFIAAFLVLPLVGFPVSVFLVLAGIRFGLGGGMAVAAGGMLFHHFAAYRVTHGLFRDRLRQRLEHAGYAIPPIKTTHRVWFTALFAAIHGPPYIAKLYLLALTDVPFRIYFWVGAPVYIFFCLIPVGAGSAVMRFDATWIYVLAGVSAAFLLAGYWLRRRFGAAARE